MSESKPAPGTDPIKQLEQKVLQTAGKVVEAWVSTRKMTGDQDLDDALQQLSGAYRDWADNQEPAAKK